MLGGAAAWIGGNHLTLRALELARHTPAPEAVGDLLDAMREITDGHALAKDLAGKLPTPDESLHLADGRTAAVFAFAVSAMTGQSLIGLLLAYAPGRVAEMSLIAFAIDANPGFVAVHHLVRIIFVMVMVPIMALWFAGSLEGTKGT